jgi:hypothetical protein
MESQQENEEAHRIEFPRVETAIGESFATGGSITGVKIDNLIIRDSIQRIGAADPANVQQIAASQLELLAGYHQIALAQSRRSFFWALVGSGVGLIFFVAAVAFALATGLLWRL